MELIYYSFRLYSSREGNRVRGFFLACFEFHIIRENANVVWHPSNNKSIAAYMRNDLNTNISRYIQITSYAVVRFKSMYESRLNTKNTKLWTKSNNLKSKSIAAL